MAVFKKTLAFLLVLTIILSIGEVFAFAMDEAPPVAGLQETVDEPGLTDEAPPVESSEEVPPVMEREETSEEAPPVTVPGPVATPEVTPEEVPEQKEEAAPSVQEEEKEASEEPAETEEEPQTKVWPWTEPGNEIVEILGGGRHLVSGSRFYYSENGLWLEEGGSVTLLASVDAENLNLCDGWLYYTVDNTVWRMIAAGGTPESVYTADDYIWMLYVMGQELRYISGGEAYSYDMGDGALAVLEAPSGLLGLIPTPYGNLYLTGEIFNYTLWAEMTQLQTGIDSAYPDGDWLVVVNSSGTWQTSLSALFDGVVNLTEYNLHQAEMAAAYSGLSEEEQLANEADFMNSEEYLALQAALEEPSNYGIATLSISHVRTKSLTTNQQNIVARAQQMSQVIWTCLKWRYSWGGNDSSYVSANYNYNAKVTATDGTVTRGYFNTGKSYKGVPYSQAVYTGYVGWDVSIKDFLNATKNTSSSFYSGYSTFSKTAPYYGSDCAGFVSWAWDLPVRCTCTSLLNYSKYIGNHISQIQIGDCLNNPSSHVVLVTDIGYDSKGNVVSIEITEQTPCKMKVTCYGEWITGSNAETTGTLGAVQSAYLNNGYSIYRRSCSSRPTVSKPSDDAGLSYASAPTMKIEATGAGSAKVTLSHTSSSAVIYYTTDGTVATSASKKYTGPFTVSKETTINAIAVVTGYKNSFSLNETVKVAAAPVLTVAGDAAGTGIYEDKGTYYVQSGKSVTLTAGSGATIYYTTDGSTPTMSSSKVTSSTAIKVNAKTTVKAFTVKDDAVPSALATFTVEPGTVYGITVNDPYGFISPSGVVGVLEGKDITFTISTVSGYTLGDVKVDGTSIGTGKKSYTFSNVSANHTISAEVKLPFTDVGGSRWYAPAVAFVYSHGLFAGVTQTSFSPNDNMTRAQFITVLGRFANPGSTISGWTGIMGVTNGTDINVRSSTTTSSSSKTTIHASGQYIKVLSTVSTGVDGGTWYQVSYNGYTGYVRKTMPSTGKILLTVCGFTDINTTSGSYYGGYAQWANLNGIIEGTNTAGTTFSPGDSIRRQDICVILYRYLTQYLGMKLSEGTVSFKDSSSITSYAKTAVSAMANIGVVTGDESGYFNPLASATRAEVATMFMRLYNYING